MASVQVQKPTTTKSVITLAQSIALVQTCLHGCLSTLFWAREIFPEKAFKERRYAMRDIIPTYDEYNLENDRRDGSQDPETHFNALSRGYSKRADMFLDWLETGVFDALRNTELKAVQLCVHPDPLRRDKVLETYTFTVKYGRDRNGAKTPNRIELSGESSSGVVCVENANTSFQLLLRRVDDLCQRMPPLPKERYISLNMILFKDTKNSKMPSGFRLARNGVLLFPHAKGWKKWTDTFDDLNSEFHRTGLKISHMVHGREIHGPPTSYPEWEGFIHEAAEEDDIDDEAVASLVSKVPETQSEEKNNSGVPKSAVNGSKGRSEPDMYPSHASQSNDGANTQSSSAAKTKMALHLMMRPEEITQGDTQINDFAKPLSGKSADSAAVPTVKAVSTLPGGASQPDDVYKVAYVNDKLHYKQVPRAVLLKGARNLAQRIGSTTKSGQIILCQCGCARQEGDLVQCESCGNWQHFHCYGYTGKDDIRRPAVHHCYVCIVPARDDTTLKALLDLALERRCMFHVLQHGLRGKSDFAESLSINHAITSPLFTQIRKSGYVVAASGSHKAGFKATGKPQWVPASGAAYEDMLDRYFDPVTHLSGYLEPPVCKPSSLASRLTFSKSTNMPPPATPIAEKRKRTVSSPSSELDLPEHRTRYVTPTPRRPRGDGVSTRPKRILDDEETETGSTKRPMTPAAVAKMLANFESSRMIDAGAFSSPL